jgi:predicted metal-dependent HD superfamily phosphohydrolase
MASPVGSQYDEQDLVQELKDSLIGRNAVFDSSKLSETDFFGSAAAKDDDGWICGSLNRWWQKAMQGRDNNAGDVWFKRLWELYSKPGRYYHTSVHVLELVSYFDLICLHGYPGVEDERIVVLLAIFFHDAVYDSQSSVSSEDESVALFREYASEMRLEDSVAEQVVHFIEATKNHMTVAATTDSSLLKLFLDLDLSVLAKTRNAYMSYAAAIRQEYSHVPASVYCPTRANILSKFLTGTLYQTPVLRQAWEERAKANLQEEINLLQQGIIPGV